MTDRIRLPRKLKKRIIECFGKGTYQGIIEKCLVTERYHNNKGVVIRSTAKGKKNEGSRYFHPGQYNPYMLFPTIYHPKSR